MKKPGIIIGGWVPEEFPLERGLATDTMIQVYVRAPADNEEMLKRGETHWISVQMHQEILAKLKDSITEEIARYHLDYPHNRLP